jgi:hypothetical protein
MPEWRKHHYDEQLTPINGQAKLIGSVEVLSMLCWNNKHPVECEMLAGFEIWRHITCKFLASFFLLVWSIAT